MVSVLVPGGVSKHMILGSSLILPSLVGSIGASILSLNRHHRCFGLINMNEKVMLVDDREMTQHPEIPTLLGMDVCVVRLDAADFCFLDRNKEPVGIERSKITNLMEKLRSGELESQMRKCQNFYPSIILLVEDVYDLNGGLLAVYKKGNKGYFRNYIYPHTHYKVAKAVEISLSGMGIEVLSSPNLECSMQVVRLLYEQRTKPEEAHTLFKKIRRIKIPVKRTANPNVPMLMALVPTLPETTAIRLIYEYDTIWNIIHTGDKELLRVNGMGKGLLRKLKSGVGKP